MKNLLAFLGIGLAAGIAVAGSNKSAGNKQDKPEEGFNPLPEKKEPENNPGGGYTPPPTDNFPLQYGSSGANVGSLQQLMISYAKAYKLGILTTDPLPAGAPPVFGPWTQRWVTHIFGKKVVSLQDYQNIAAKIAQAPKSNEATKAPTNVPKKGTVVYAKGKRTLKRYSMTEPVSPRGSRYYPTLEEGISWINKGGIARSMDSIEFDHAEAIGVVAQVVGTDVRILATEQTPSKWWYINPVMKHKQYFKAKLEDLFY